MSKFSGNPLFEGHLDLPEQAKAFDRSERTIIRYTELPKDPLPYIELPNGEKIFNIETSKKWLARRERSALPTPRRRGRRHDTEIAAQQS
jgi:hypothetical protein